MKARVAAALLLLLFAVQEVLVTRRLSAVFDEIAHIGAGYGYAAAGDYRLNDEHPPLVKLLAGLAIRGMPVRDVLASRAWSDGDQWSFGLQLLTHESVPRWALLDRARLPMIAFGLLGGASLFLLTEMIFGARSALLALMLYVGCPTILAHGVLVTTDAPMMATGLFSVLAASRLRKRFDGARVAVLGISIALALLVKFNAVVILAVLAVILLGPGEGRLSPRRVGIVVAAAAVATIVVALLVYRGARAFTIFPVGFLHAFSRSKALAGYPFYLFGRYSSRGFWSYFPLALVLKMTVPSLLLVALGVTSYYRRRPSTDELCAILLPLAAWSALTVALAANIGIRYLLPAFPFLFAIAARFVADASGRRLWLGFVLAGFHVITGLSARDPLGYTNLLIDERRAIAYLDDSNVDWGQGLRALEKSVARRPAGAPPVRCIYFGGFSVESLLRGLPVTDVAPSDLLDPSVRAVPPGSYAVSTQLLLRAPGLRALLARSCGTAEWLGPSMQIYCCPRCVANRDEPLLSLHVPPPPSAPLQ